MDLAIKIIKAEIAQRELANKHKHLRRAEVDSELKSLYKALETLEGHEKVC